MYNMKKKEVVKMEMFDQGLNMHKWLFSEHVDEIYTFLNDKDKDNLLYLMDGIHPVTLRKYEITSMNCIIINFIYLGFEFTEVYEITHDGLLLSSISFTEKACEKTYTCILRVIGDKFEDKSSDTLPPELIFYVNMNKHKIISYIKNMNICGKSYNGDRVKMTFKNNKFTFTDLNYLVKEL